MRNAGMDEAQVGIKIAGRKISATSDMQMITLMAEAEEELYTPWNSPGQNTRMGSHSFFQGIFSTQGMNPGLPVCRGPAPADPGYSKGRWRQRLFTYLFIKDIKNNRMRIAQ